MKINLDLENILKQTSIVIKTLKNIFQVKNTVQFYLHSIKQADTPSSFMLLYPRNSGL